MRPPAGAYDAGGSTSDRPPCHGHRSSTKHLARIAITCLTLLLLTALGSLPLHTLAQEDVTLRDADTADTADPAVIAQGVVALPAPQAVWFVRRPEAETADDSSPAARNLGFTLATGGPLLIADQGTGARSRLSRGEAVFTAQGASQVVTSLGDDETDFLEVSLLPSTTSADAPDGGPFSTGDAFPVASGDRDIALVIAVLDRETSLSLNSSKAPALVYAPDGLRYAIGRAAIQDLAEGEAISLTGRITLFAPEEGDATDPVRVYAAVIVDVFACPDGTNLPTIQTDSVYDCSPVPAGQGIDGALETPAGDVLNADSDGESTAVFTDLPSGGYAVNLPDVDGGAYGICGSSKGLAGLITSFAVGSGRHRPRCGGHRRRRVGGRRGGLRRDRPADLTLSRPSGWCARLRRPSRRARRPAGSRGTCSGPGTSAPSSR